MRLSKWIVAFILIVHLVLCADLLLPVAVWDGRFPLTVHVSSTAGELRSITCQAMQNRFYSECAVQDPACEAWSSRAETIEAFDGTPFDINVPVSGKTSAYDREISRTQFQYLAIVAEMTDGRRVSKVVQIPDGRKTRNLCVSLP